MKMEIGQKVKVKGIKQQPIPPAAIVNQLKKNPIGTIKEFKMVDGSGIGFWVEFEENIGTWFFEEELTPVS
ncbi:MAG: DUF2862 domain-containing protein [Okeania sp. SIO3B5]|nr:DUF2862 domain-containing protein [Okeania sp. SIO3B5]NEO52308.1 DUF2862 domain-containing protein [Okeania sp. SIO3B5]